MEIWKESGMASGFEVSSLGRVRTSDTKIVLRQHANGKGGAYRSVSAAGAMFLVHRLVAEAFVPNPERLPIVMHRDDEPANNTPGNLRWGTLADNNRARAEKGRTRNQHNGKTECAQGHPFDAENTYLRQHGDRTWRVCRRCKLSQIYAKRARDRAAKP